MSDGSSPWFVIDKIPDMIQPVLNLYLETLRRRLEDGSRAGEEHCTRALRDFGKTMETQHMRLYLAAGNDSHFNGFADSYFRNEMSLEGLGGGLRGIMYMEGMGFCRETLNRLKRQPSQV
jgi:hypothetical protein